MKTYLLAIVVFICSIQIFYSQEDDGVVSLALPIRNSLAFNQYAINPTFSFVRQQNAALSISNKREWVQFENAPQTYLLSYAGRFKENIGVGVGVFQQNYGVLTTFGGLLNFAYNARLDTDSNLSFGVNIGAYKSGVNDGNVVTNNSDPSLEEIPSNFLVTINPGINYGTGFFDFGVSLNNYFLYNSSASEIIQENPKKGIQGHIMYTGYVESYGFLDESKFSGLIKSEFTKGKTIFSGIAMLTVPMGVWAHVGYNNLYGVSGGLGLNISKQFSIEYSFEKAIGNLSDFGPSHEITLAYKFKNREKYDYSSEDRVSSLFTKKRRKKRPKASNTSKEAQATAQANRELAEQRRAEARLATQERVKARAEARKKLIAANKAKAEERRKFLAENRNKSEAEKEADRLAKLEADRLAKEEADRIAAQNEADRLAQQEADRLAKLEADRLAKEEAD
ncbi:PorP/SprF family type IX secretion system membrane protein, partial [uncultured Lacinutrix sp.]|uniref:PorP/SprF family type IX secretion system membrane protein n=1 Tax=uncultured Lacinutrix sp. TaxID=574032 RepID=UPI00261F815B